MASSSVPQMVEGMADRLEAASGFELVVQKAEG